ncbi:MAG: ArsC/Spx/MgsR family protein [Candidatus Sericytochromatia bacterium]|nr:ArsC/Spx/MgsR family protein [Candidatus Sericytochromatia bacterium]
MKPLTLFTKTGCSTCLKARQLLNDWQVPYTERDIFKHPLEPGELADLVKRVSLHELFSWRSPTARQQGFTPTTSSPETLVLKMLEEPRLIRRPLLLAGETLIVGCLPEQMREAIHAP